MGLLLLKLLVFTVLVPATVVVYLPRGILDGAIDRGVALPVRIAAVVLFGIGFSIYLWTALDFARRGRGTPAPIDPPKHLVVHGLYRYVRNPMYVGVLSMIFAEVLYTESAALLWYALGVALLFHLAVLVYEEPSLERRFGAEYDEYRKAVGRWLPRSFS